MNTEMEAMPVIAWAQRNLPARLDVTQTAKLLGLAEIDLRILMAAKHLKPLGTPARNAPKWFAGVEVMRLAMDEAWLHGATRELSKYWKHKRLRQRNAGHTIAKKQVQEPTGNSEVMAGGMTNAK